MFEIMPFDRRTYRMSCYNPLRELEQMEKSFWGEQQVNPFRTDISETADGYKLEADLPGFRKEDIDITLENQTLTIAAERRTEQKADPEASYLLNERRYSRFLRSFTLPPTIDEKSVAAKLDNGVLTVTLKKREETKPRKIAVG